ncbi:MAG: hypothetical protein OEZ32_00875 [Nitrospinota bacterium]|nr:hypothetical protein [Nitrospinota bacterium]
MAALAHGCSSGSGDNSGVSQTAETGSPYLSGVYEFKVDVATANCSDGSHPRQGFNFLAEIIQNGDFLEARRDGQTIGRGDIDKTGKFHMSGALEAQGLKIVVNMDGQADGKTLSGESKSAWETAPGLRCSHVSGFTATPSQGGV